MGRGSRTSVASASSQQASRPRVTRDGYDAQAHLRRALAEPPLAGCERVALTPLTELSELIAAQPTSVVAVSDVHGDFARLQEVLSQLGVIDADGQRVAGRGYLVQVGDLMDGREPEGDLRALALGGAVFDKLLAGNHEAAVMGGKRFGGLDFVSPEVRRELERLAREERLDAAYVAHGVLLSHAGANRSLYDSDDPQAIAQQINDDWVHFYYRNSHHPDTLFAHTAHRGRGGTAAHGGALWQDFSQLAQPEQHSTVFRQLTGHSVLGGVERSLDGQVWCIDTAGPRLGVAVITPDGTITCGSDVIPVDQAIKQ